MRMFLEKLEIQGFKSFTQKTTLIFPARKNANPGIAAIVGPNGSGKSNVADAVRWVLGEQSVKLLRGKRAEDVIFSGSGTRSRLGFAEVTLYLNNEEKIAGVEYEHIAVKRRVYRDGSSEYYINGARVRLADIQLLLAQAHFGQRTYSVIGQGMVDAILSASPFERKGFFDEATGVKQYQMKREQAAGKIKTTEENLTQLAGLLKEIKPRLSGLARQMKRLEQRSGLETELHKLQLEHYGALWHALGAELARANERKRTASTEHLGLTKQLAELQNKLTTLEHSQEKGGQSGYEKAQSNYRRALLEKNELAIATAALARELELKQNEPASGKRPAHAAALVLLAKKQLAFLKKLAAAESGAQFTALQTEAKKLSEEIEAALAEKTSPEKEAPNREGERKLESLRERMRKAEGVVREAEQEMDRLSKTQSQATSGVFKIQKEYQVLQQKLNEITSRKNEADILLARLETRQEDLAGELEKEVSPALRARITAHQAHGQKTEQNLWPEIAKIKHELETIGGIDPEVDKEFRETKERHDFLETQTRDLEEGLEKTKKAARDLDGIIEREFGKSFSSIQKYFNEYFKTLFGGGSADLKLQRENELDMLTEEAAATLTEDERARLADEYRTGITIAASPPNKKVSSISMLSGGERALVSIALICSIIKTNPSPFVVLDEVDAALDEANSERFALILEKLARETQFVAITHNRSTMEKASILYGVTMGADGVSKLLSVDLEKAVASAKS